MTIGVATPAQVAEVVTNSVTAFQGGVEIGSSANAFEVYTNVLNASASMLQTTPIGVPLAATAAANGTLATFEKWRSGTLAPSDIMGLTGTAFALVTAAAALAGIPITPGLLAVGFGVSAVAGVPLKEPFNDLARWLGDWILENDVPGVTSPLDPSVPFWGTMIPPFGFDPNSFDPMDPSAFDPNAPFAPLAPLSPRFTYGPRRKFEQTCRNPNFPFSSPPTYRVVYIDPLAIDLDGDGLETVGVDGSYPIVFDHDGDRIKTGTGWVAADDAWLVRDLNGNGQIDSGAEMFGDRTLLANGTMNRPGI